MRKHMGKQDILNQATTDLQKSHMR